MRGNLAEKIVDAARTSFIDAAYESEENLRAKLLFNDVKRGSTVLANLERELSECDNFWFSVAFITKSGLVTLKETLKELQKRNIQGRVLTTDYLTFNDPDALEDLLNYSNIEVKIFEKEDFHTKGYMFGSEEKKTFLIGSSNLTQGALKKNKEWNLKVTSLENGELIQETEEEFTHMWQEAEMLTVEWVEEYRRRYIEQKKRRKVEKVARIKSYTLKPNKMQEEAIISLANIREQGEERALLISATGTGKTYLSAFDVRNCKPKKMLFLVHREQILKTGNGEF